jgi:hypothetical protein
MMPTSSEDEGNTGNTSHTNAAEAREKTLLPAVAGWLILAGLFAYTGFIHQGLGAAAGGVPTEWFHPTGFLLDWDIVGSAMDAPVRGVAMLCFPAALLAAGVFLGTRSAVARALAISCVVSVAIFSFYGLAALRIWEFFHWRASVVMAVSGLAIGFALMAPLLSETWLKHHWSVKLLTYIPFCFAIIALIRNATGTDEKLFFNFSPWPAIPVLGLEIGAYTIVGMLFGMAVGVAALADARRRPVRAAAGALAGIAVSVVWFYSRFGNTEAGGLVALGVITALVIGLAAIARGGNRGARLRRRALHLALGALLVTLPLLGGRALANSDYSNNRFVRARIITDALATYFEKQEEYPEELEELIEKGYLDELPRPRVGFDIFADLGLLKRTEFSYRGLGSSYVLEFVSTEWVQCAYNPPWEDDYEYEEEYEDEEEAEDGEEGQDEEGSETEEAWSCPDTRPELW